MLALLLIERTDDVSGVCDVLHCGGVSRGNSVTGVTCLVDLPSMGTLWGPCLYVAENIERGRQRCRAFPSLGSSYRGPRRVLICYLVTGLRSVIWSTPAPNLRSGFPSGGRSRGFFLVLVEQ